MAAAIFKRFGDEQSTLLDQYERLSFEVHLNQAMLGRSLSEPAVAPRCQPPPKLAAKPGKHGRRVGGSGFNKVMKKLLSPILGKKGAGKDGPGPDAKDPMFWKTFSKSLRQSPCHRPSTFLHPSVQFPSVDALFFFAGNSINRRKFHLFATPIKEKQSIYGHTSNRKLQVQDFLETVVTVPISEKLEAFEKFQRNGEMQTISEFNHLLMSLVAADEFELALKLKSNLSSFGLFPDNWTYSILVSCYCKKNEPIEAKSVLDHMLETGFEPNVATFTALINSFCENGRLRDAYEVFDIMSRIGCEPTINTYNCLLKGLCYVGRVEEAFDLMESIKKSSMKPDIYTYTAMMDGFCKVGRSNEAFDLLNEALEMELRPSVVTYNTLFNGYFKEGKPLFGFGVLRRMKERKCKPDYISYSTLLHGLLKWGKIKAALDVYNQMVENGLRVDERMMNTLLRGLCRRARKEKVLLKYAYNVFEEMSNRNYVVYADTYDLVVEAFCNGREIGRAFEIFNEMVKIGHSPKTFTFNIVIRALCGVGEVRKGLTVLMLMHKDRKPSRIPFNFLINELNRQGRSLPARNVYGMALKRGVVPKRKPRKYLAEQGTKIIHVKV
ncbi:hypothetical protein DH2020_048095 [Rehmannia glutinosa]|uniref:Pentatricopeptide repeat-containing protein n=1 Tax=Rehmannia glutinosa TaxID=99300 RepID=A0ABR0U6Q5_REHGL